MENQFHFKKKFGQNFLIDQNIVKKIVKSNPILNNSLVIEIGPGDGRLTKELCNSFDNVLSYEIDTEVKPYLEERLKDYNNYSIIFDDFLNRDLKNDIKDYKYQNLYVIANLPYYITTPIIEKLINSKLEFNFMTFMVQKEVGDRFSAEVGTKSYNSLTVYLNYYFDIKKQFIVSRNSFIPKPNVDSVVITLLKKETKLKVINEDLFFKLVRDSFRFKRKTLRNNLKEYDLIKVNEVLKTHNLDLSVRAEALCLNIFCDIANSLSI